VSLNIIVVWPGCQLSGRKKCLTNAIFKYSAVEESGKAGSMPFSFSLLSLCRDRSSLGLAIFKKSFL